VHGGEGFSASERYDVDKAIRDAETVSRYEFSVYVGAADQEALPFARRLHAAMTAPDRSVLVMVDPTARLLEIVTGAEVRRDLEDGEVHLSALAMQTAFAEGDLVGGIIRGVTMLAEHARRPRMLHAGS
jgi:hypothetical protein